MVIQMHQIRHLHRKIQEFPFPGSHLGVCTELKLFLINLFIRRCFTWGYQEKKDRTRLQGDIQKHKWIGLFLSNIYEPETARHSPGQLLCVVLWWMWLNYCSKTIAGRLLLERQDCNRLSAKLCDKNSSYAGKNKRLAHWIFLLQWN